MHLKPTIFVQSTNTYPATPEARALPIFAITPAPKTVQR